MPPLRSPRSDGRTTGLAGLGAAGLAAAIGGAVFAVVLALGLMLWMRRRRLRQSASSSKGSGSGRA